MWSVFLQILSPRGGVDSDGRSDITRERQSTNAKLIEEYSSEMIGNIKFLNTPLQILRFLGLM